MTVSLTCLHHKSVSGLNLSLLLTFPGPLVLQVLLHKSLEYLDEFTSIIVIICR